MVFCYRNAGKKRKTPCRLDSARRFLLFSSLFALTRWRQKVLGLSLWRTFVQFSKQSFACDQIGALKVFNNREAPAVDLRPHLKEIRVPALVIVGRHNFITNVAMAEEMVRHIPNARLEIFEDSGHFAPIEEPAKFRQVIQRFVFSGS